MATELERPQRLAILIDADNASPRAAAAIFEEIATIGEASARRIYGDFSGTRLKGWSEVLATYAIIPQQNFANTVGKNASDIALVIDAMDLLHSGRFDGFCLVSSDSDFTRLAARIREQGLDVYGIGEKKTPEAFRMACKRFIYVENLGATETPEPEEAAPRPARGEVEPAPRTSAKEPPASAIPLIVAAMRAIDPEGEWFTLGPLGQFITQANPDFDTRTYGAAKLSDLVRKLPRFEIRQGPGGQLELRDRA